MATGEHTNGGRARAYAALHASEELHRATLSSISDAVFLTDDEGRFTYICPNVGVIFGYVPDEVEAMARIGALLGESLFDHAALDAHGEIQNIERDIRCKSGEHRTVLVNVKAVSIQGGTVLYTCRDVTDRKRAEEELRAVRQELAHASRLALLGALSASIGHEVKQPIASILMNASAALRLLDADATVHGPTTLSEILVDIRDESRVASDFIDRLQGLAGKRALEPQPLDINELTNEIIRWSAATRCGAKSASGRSSRRRSPQ